MPDYNGVHLGSNGKYWVAWWHDDQGIRRAKSLGPKAKLMKRDAQNACLDLAIKHRARPSTRSKQAAYPLAQWRDRYTELRTDIGTRTRQAQRHTLARLVAHFGAGRDIGTITRADAAGWRASMARAGSTEQTVRKHISIAKTVFGWAHRLDLIEFNPFDREVCAPLQVDHDWHYLTLDALGKLLDACPNDNWRSLFAIARLAGLRRGEILRLQWADVNWQTHTLAVRHVGLQTTKRRARIVPMAPQLYKLLLTHYGSTSQSARVVEMDSVPSRTNPQLRAIVAAAGMDLWDKPLHTLRKNCETDWLATFPIMDVCAWLGHDPTVAAKHYHQARPEVMAGVTTPTAPTPAPEVKAVPKS